MPAQTGERLVSQPDPRAAAPAVPSAPRPGQPGAQGGGITVPPLPPIPGPGNGSRRPLASEDFEEELDIPEFLRSQ
jgi:cell division protein FtsZ